MIKPGRVRFHAVGCAYLDTVASLEYGLDRAQLSVDTCVRGVLADAAVDLECKVESCSALRKDDTFTLRSKYHDVIIVE